MRGGGNLRLPGRMPSHRMPSSTNWLAWGSIGLAGLVALAALAGGLLYFLTRPAPAPLLIVQQPVGSSRAEAGQPVLIQGQATDRTGVTRVELWVDGMLNTTIPSPQPGGQRLVLVDHPWTPSSGGAHTLSLIAYNSEGRSSEAHTVIVTVSGPDTTPDSAAQPPPPPIAPQADTLPPEVGVTVAVACSNSSSFVADVTVPDHSAFIAGARFDKTWRVRNSGTCSWGPGYRLLFSSGDQMGAPSYQAVSATPPGGTADITIGMSAPASPGTYKGIWRMAGADGSPFGQSLSVVIQVTAGGGGEQGGIQPDTGLRSDVGFARLTVRSPQGTVWSDPTGATLTAIQWQDAQGSWNTVETWVTPLTSPEVVWEVFRKDYNTGPFRWVVYDVDKILGESAPFYLPGGDGDTVNVVVALSDLPSH
jgi:hypothetical protein